MASFKRKLSKELAFWLADQRVVLPVQRECLALGESSRSFVHRYLRQDQNEDNSLGVLRGMLEFHNPRSNTLDSNPSSFNDNWLRMRDWFKTNLKDRDDSWEMYEWNHEWMPMEDSSDLTTTLRYLMAR